MMSPEEITARIADLRRKLRKREGAANMAENVAAIKSEIARLEQL
jgi:uncharacterized small protein (DUF1192 family)